MAIMSSGKSSSMAAVLLLVAVVAAGTCASGAQAFNITNLCNKTVVITTDTGASNSTLLPGGSLQVDVPPNLFFTAPVTITITGTGTPPVNVTIQVPQFVLQFINLLNGVGLQVQKIEIICEGNCVTIVVTYKPLMLCPETVSLGPFCP